MAMSCSYTVTGILYLTVFLSEALISEWRQQMTTHVTDVSHAFSDSMREIRRQLKCTVIYTSCKVCGGCIFTVTTDSIFTAVQ